MGAEIESVVVAVLTYRRADELSALLPILVQQASSVSTQHRSVGIIVVDNDPVASARAIVSSAASTAALRGIEIRYRHEPEPGISSARNCALDAAAADDVLVFIDDDERPTSKWLPELLSVRDQYAAEVVQGPVVSEFEQPLDPWIVAGGFFRRRRMPTGTVLDVAVTNNLLLELAPIRRLGLRFDLELGTTGGEDTLFTRSLYRAGVRMIWSAEAVVVDIVPEHRATRRWVTQRAISTGNATALVTLKLSDERQRVVSRLALISRACARLVGGGLKILVGKVRKSDPLVAQGARTGARGLGMALGALGYGYHEYARDGQSSVQRINWRRRDDRRNQSPSSRRQLDSQAQQGGI